MSRQHLARFPKRLTMCPPDSERCIASTDNFRGDGVNERPRCMRRAVIGQYCKQHAPVRGSALDVGPL